MVDGVGWHASGKIDTVLPSGKFLVNHKQKRCTSLAHVKNGNEARKLGNKNGSVLRLFHHESRKQPGFFAGEEGNETLAFYA
jgi:hypothetical protein